MPHRFDDDRTISPAGFERLLFRLDPDVDRAALEYEQLRRTLVKFFDWRGGWPPDECADETLDRLARKLEEVVVDNIRQYAAALRGSCCWSAGGIMRRRSPIRTRT